MMERISGEQFTQQLKFGTAAYDECDQIVVVFSNTRGNKAEAVFVKVPDPDFPGAKILTKNQQDSKIVDLFFSRDLTLGMDGYYTFEVKRVVSGAQMPILKGKDSIYHFSKSQTK